MQKPAGLSGDVYRALFTGANDALLIADGDTGVILDANPRAAELFRLSLDALIGMHQQALHPPEVHDATKKAFLHHLAHPEVRTIETLIITADGTRVPVEISAGSTAADGRRFVLGLFKDIAVRKGAEAARTVAQSQAELANRNKTEFLANLSHELRTPLNAIIGFSEMLKGQMFGPLSDRYQDYARTIHESGCHLLRIIDDLLNMARLESGRYDLTECELVLNEVVETAVARWRPEAIAAGIDLVHRTPSSLPMLWADRNALLQILHHLVGNAVKFTGPGGRITVSAAVATGGSLDIAVADTGCGIPRHVLHRLASPFEQGETGLARLHGGLGLGLAMCKTLTGLHGGTFTIASEAGAGTTVTVSFPYIRLMKAA